jgi:hypothetical protein
MAHSAPLGLIGMRSVEQHAYQLAVARWRRYS